MINNKLGKVVLSEDNEDVAANTLYSSTLDFTKPMQVFCHARLIQNPDHICHDKTLEYADRYINNAHAASGLRYFEACGR